MSRGLIEIAGRKLTAKFFSQDYLQLCVNPKLKSAQLTVFLRSAPAGPDLKRINKMSGDEINDRGGTRSGKDRRMDQFSLQIPERRNIKNRRSGCDRRARLNYEDQRKIERRSTLRVKDQKV
jgi:hypothetical protein